MDIRSFFCGGSSSKSPGHSSSSDAEDKIDSNQSDTEFLEPSPAKKRLIVHEKHAKERLTTHEKNHCKQSKIQQKMGRELQLADV